MEHLVFLVKPFPASFVCQTCPWAPRFWGWRRQEEIISHHCQGLQGWKRDSSKLKSRRLYDAETLWCGTLKRKSFSFQIFFFFWCGPFLKILLNLSQYPVVYGFFFFHFFVCLFGFEAWATILALTRTPCIGRCRLHHWTTREVSANQVIFPLDFCLSTSLLLCIPFTIIIEPWMYARHCAKRLRM